MCVMVDQREALAVTTRLTDTVYFGLPYRDSNRQPLGQKAVTLHFTTRLSCTLSVDFAYLDVVIELTLIIYPFLLDIFPFDIYFTLDLL